MLLFSEYLRELLQAKHLTISALSRLSGVERTALSKALTGQRVLPYDALDLLIYHLRLTPKEEQQLRLYYDMQFEKEGVRQAREVVSELFSDLANLNFSMLPFEETRLLLSLDEYTKGNTIFSGPTNVRHLLRVVLTEEVTRPGARVEMTVPPSACFFNDEILYSYIISKTAADVTQIITFDPSGSAEDVNLHNLDCFRRVLPACLLSKQKYHPYYYFDHTVTARYTDPFPYFMVTQGCVVCLSEDGSQAMLLTEKEQIAYCHRHFQNLLKRCRSLVRCTFDPLEAIASHDACIDPDGIYVAADQPCLGQFYTDDLVERSLRKDVPGYDMLSRAVKDWFATLRRTERCCTLFTKSGLTRFMETGLVDDFPEDIVSPFPVEERRELLRKLAADIRSGKITGRLMEEGAFPDYLSMTTTNSSVGLFTTERFPRREGFCSIQIQEPNLCRAFHDWLTHLPNSTKALSVEETVQALEEMIQQTHPVAAGLGCSNDI